MSWLLTMVIWTVFGGLYAAAISFAMHDLARRYVWHRFEASRAALRGDAS